MLIEFKKPFNFEGKEYNSVDLDLDSLTGADMAAVKKIWLKSGQYGAVAATDPEFCAFVAARAAKKPIEFFHQLPARDYIAITTEVANFLCS